MVDLFLEGENTEMASTTIVAFEGKVIQELFTSLLHIYIYNSNSEVFQMEFVKAESSSRHYILHTCTCKRDLKILNY